MQEFIRQLGGIGPGRSIGFGPNRVASLPDGVARALAEYLADSDTTAEPDPTGAPMAFQAAPTAPSPNQMALKIGDICPECGEATLVNEEGCRKCYSCSFSQC